MESISSSTFFVQTGGDIAGSDFYDMRDTIHVSVRTLLLTLPCLSIDISRAKLTRHQNLGGHLSDSPDDPSTTHIVVDLTPEQITQHRTILGLLPGSQPVLPLLPRLMNGFDLIAAYGRGRNGDMNIVSMAELKASLAWVLIGLCPCVPSSKCPN